MITIKGILERLTYQNPDNHYTVARFRVAKINDPVTVVGHLAGVCEGESLEISGGWTSHPKYGDQFKAQVYKVILPATVSGIRSYLGSGMIRGIGRSMADRIVDFFGEETFDIIENDPDQLTRINGIGKAKKKVIEEAWNKHHAVRKVMQYLQENGVGVYHAAEILKLYGSGALAVLKENPYVIARDLPGPGFSIADKIAANAGIEKDDPNRLAACLFSCLLSFEQDGHVYALQQDLFREAAASAGVPIELFDTALAALADADDVKLEDTKDESRVYLSWLFRAEARIAARVKAISSLPPNDYQLDSGQILEQVLSRLAVKLSEEQLSVVEGVLKEKIVIITGGPGTGKTTLIKALCAVFDLQQEKVVLGAPTGRAARRLSEVSGKKAFTLHKLLGFDHENRSFDRNVGNPLDLDVFIVDEASMVDTMLMYRLTDALPAGARLIMVGDTFQLPSVGPGNVLSDMIESKAIMVYSLTKIFRQAQQSPIIRYAHNIRNGEMPQFEKASEGTLSEFYFIETRQPARVASTILELCAERIPKAFPHIEEIQVLTPMHRGDAGTINLNQQLQEVLNPASGGMTAGQTMFKPQDKVMHLKNNYDKEVFNGDIGIVHEVIPSENLVKVMYDDRIVDYDILELDELTLAYAISVHKSQGSEYQAVIIALTTAHFPLLQRNLLYTAMTRGRQLVIIVGSSRALEIALNNDRTDKRLSALHEKLVS